MRDHIVLCGLGKVAISTLEILADLGEQVVVVAHEIPRAWSARVERWAADIVLDDERDEDALRRAGLPEARAIIIATDDDLANLETALDALSMAPDAAVVVRLYDRELADRVRSNLPVRAVINAGTVAAGAFVAAALGERRLGSYSVGSATIDIIEVPVSESGQTVGHLAEQLNAVPVAMRHADSQAHAPAQTSTRMAAGDALVVAGARSTLSNGAHPRSAASRRERPARAWARTRRRLPDLARALWSSMSPAMRHALSVFFIVLVMSVLVFHYGWHLRWLDALYFTITTVTTVGYGDIVLMDAPVWVKLYGSGLMLCGVALLVVAFGIVTDHIVSQRFEQVLGRPKTTLRDHIIVVGLGNIGSRVAAALHAMGEPVLAIDQRDDLPFVSSVPDGVPVLTGDANDERVLQQAGVDVARSIVAVTDNDLLNLRIAQRAGLANPRIRSTVRCFSATLATKLGASTLGVDVAINPSAEAGAAFAASALAPDVLQGLRIGSRLLMLRRLAPSESMRLRGRTVQDIRATESLMVLLRERVGSTTPEVAMPEDTVMGNERLIVLQEYQPHDHAIGSPGIMDMTEASAG